MLGDPTSNVVINIANVISYIGICMILFFIGLILFSKNNRTIEGYFSAVASNSIFDLTFSIISAVIKLDSFHKNGFYVFAITRFDYEMNPFLAQIVITIWLFTGNICFGVVVIPFYIRYLLICKKQNIRYTMRILLYLLVITYDAGISLLLFMSLKVSPRELVELQMKPYLIGNEEGKYWNIIAAQIVS